MWEVHGFGGDLEGGAEGEPGVFRFGIGFSLESFVILWFRLDGGRGVSILGFVYK